MILTKHTSFVVRCTAHRSCHRRRLNDPAPTKSVERLFPLVLQLRKLLVGRKTLRRSKSILHFVLIAEDASENIREEVLNDFAHYPVVQHFTGADLEKFFVIKGAKVIGFAKSGLAQSIYAELKEHRINRPVTLSKPAGSPPTPPSGQRASPFQLSRKQDQR